MPINHKALRRDFDARVRDNQAHLFFEDMRLALEQKHLTERDFSLKQLFENFVDNGRELVESWQPNSINGGYSVQALEAANAVSTSHFSNIIGQIMFTRVMEEFTKPKYLFDSLVEVIPTQFNGEKIPGIGNIGDRAEVIGEGEQYPLAGVGEEYIETPATTKRGLILPITKEAIYFDRTGVLMKRAGDIAETIAISREKRVIDCVTGVTNTYKYKGTTYNTYNASTPFANIASSNALVDWTDIENALLKFDGMTDPSTGEPVMVDANTVLVPTALDFTARRIINATEIRFGDGASSTTQAISANPVSSNGRSYQVLSSPYVYARTSSTSTWFIGDPKRAFKYMQNWGPTVQRATENSEAAFTADVVERFKVSERGVPAVWDPRAMVKNTQ